MACSILSAPSCRAAVGTRYDQIAADCSGITACAVFRCRSAFTGFSFYGLSLFAMFYGLTDRKRWPPTVRLTAQRVRAERANLVFG